MTLLEIQICIRWQDFSNIPSDNIIVKIQT
jgi:hypothetical protein